jgi:hypothetical protein
MLGRNAKDQPGRTFAVRRRKCEAAAFTKTIEAFRSSAQADQRTQAIRLALRLRPGGTPYLGAQRSTIAAAYAPPLTAIEPLSPVVTASVTLSETRRLRSAVRHSHRWC